MKKIVFYTMFISLIGCTSIQVTYDYDKNADFTSYKTFGYTKETADLPLNQLDRNRFLDAVNNQMYQKGFSEAENADIAIDLHIKTKQNVEATATTMGMGYGPYRYGWGGGFASTQVDYNTYTDGTLFISFIDSKTEKLVWQGVGTKTIEENASPEEKEKNINYAVQQIMSKYPPE
ncbi:MAG: DUF4136 domain-containing protein [Bacteroidales bacterium]